MLYTFQQPDIPISSIHLSTFNTTVLHPSQMVFLLPVLEVDISWVVHERDGQVLFEDEEEHHHHLHRCLDTPADAVANLNKIIID